MAGSNACGECLRAIEQRGCLPPAGRPNLDANHRGERASYGPHRGGAGRPSSEAEMAESRATRGAAHAASTGMHGRLGSQRNRRRAGGFCGEFLPRCRRKCACAQVRARPDRLGACRHGAVRLLPGLKVGGEQGRSGGKELGDSTDCSDEWPPRGGDEMWWSYEGRCTGPSVSVPLDITNSDQTIGQCGERSGMGSVKQAGEGGESAEMMCIHRQYSPAQ